MQEHKEPRIINGYTLIYKPKHPNAPRTWCGYMYEHRYIMSEKLGRPLTKQEVVHHKDGNGLNNKVENLELFSSAREHAQLHSPSSPSSPSFCLACGKQKKNKNRKYCSDVCFRFSRRKVERPTKEQLQEELQNNTWVALGKKYGVSDNAVRKWARNYNLI